MSSSSTQPALQNQTPLNQSLQLAAKKSFGISQADLSNFVAEVATEHQLSSVQSNVFMAECLLRRGFFVAAETLINSTDEALLAFDGEINLPAQLISQSGLIGTLDLIDRIHESGLFVQKPTLVSWALKNLAETTKNPLLDIITMSMRFAGQEYPAQVSRMSDSPDLDTGVGASVITRIAGDVLGWTPEQKVFFQAHLHFQRAEYDEAQSLISTNASDFASLYNVAPSPVAFLCFTHEALPSDLERLRGFLTSVESNFRAVQSRCLAAAKSRPDSIPLKAIVECLRWYSLPESEAAEAAILRLGRMDRQHFSQCATIIASLWPNAERTEILKDLLLAQHDRTEASFEATWLTAQIMSDGLEARKDQSPPTLVVTGRPRDALEATRQLPSINSISIIFTDDNDESWLEASDLRDQHSANGAQSPLIHSIQHISSLTTAGSHLDAVLATKVHRVSESIARALRKLLTEGGFKPGATFETAAAIGITTRIHHSVRQQAALDTLVGKIDAKNTVIIDDGSPKISAFRSNLALPTEVIVLTPEGQQQAYIAPERKVSKVTVDDQHAAALAIQKLVNEQVRKSAISEDVFARMANRVAILCLSNGFHYQAAAKGLIKPLLKISEVDVSSFGITETAVAETFDEQMREYEFLSNGRLSTSFNTLRQVADIDPCQPLAEFLLKKTSRTWSKSLGTINDVKTQLAPKKAQRGLMTFLARDLPALLQLIELGDRVFEAGLPKAVIGLPARNAIDCHIILKARQKGVPTFVWDPALLAGEIGSALPAFSDFLLLTDTHEVEKFKSHADCSKTEVIAVGSASVDTVVNESRRVTPHRFFQQGKRAARLCVLFAAQPVQEEQNLKIISWLSRFNGGNMDLAVKLHPAHSHEMARVYQNLLETEAGKNVRFNVFHDAPNTTMLAGADLVVSRFSTIILEALGMDILSIHHRDSDYPVDFSKLGVSDGFDNEESLHTLLEEACTSVADMKKRHAFARSEFVRENPSFVSNDSSERVADLVRRQLSSS